MKLHSSQLLNTISSYSSARHEFAKCLDSDANFIGVYYLTPLANLQQILASGGIKPRNLIRESVIDCSDYTVQSRRKYPINLMAADGRKVWKGVHDCVNFFLNPINDTLYQFRRNARLGAVQKNMPSYMGAVSLIELDAIRLLNDQNLAWAVSDRNIASSITCVQISSDVKVYQSFDWNHIYSIKEGQQSDSYNGIRSAEFVVDTHPMEYISTEYIHRIITFESDAVPPEAINFGLCHLHTICDDPKIAAFNDPLYTDKNFWDNIKSLEINETLENVCTDLLRLESKIGRLLQKDFDLTWIASGKHGVGHVTRVMLWVALLAHLAREKGFPVSDSEMEAAVFAAYIHDLCRTSNQPDTWHGEVAAEKFSEWLRSKLPHDTQYQSCRQAIIYHCRTDIPDRPDVVWQLLKDADALDRGRFGAPERVGGCNLDYLTHPMFKYNRWFAKKCAWIAYRLARMTNINWGSSTALSLLDMLRQSRRLVEQASIKSYAYTYICL